MATIEPAVLIRKGDLTAGGALSQRNLQTVANLMADQRAPRRALALLPSDTCYGISAIPGERSMSRLINRVLHRKEEPISLAFDGLPMVEKWVQLSVPAARVLEALTPGPITVVCPAADDIPTGLHDDALAVPDGTIGVRIPDSQIERQIANMVEIPVTTVAVRHGSARVEVRDFELAVDIVTTGLSELPSRTRPPLIAVERRGDFYGAHSTVVRFWPVPSGGVEPEILRAGAISRAEIDDALETTSRWERRNWP